MSQANQALSKFDIAESPVTNLPIATPTSLDADFVFAQEDQAELPTSAAVLRYVAAINTTATRAMFLDAAERAGYPRNTATNRFYESRKVSLEMAMEDYGPEVGMDREGRIVYPEGAPV